MRILVDMNLSPDWVAVLEGEGFEAVHWSTVGDANAQDSVIIEWARPNHYVIFTHDLDFGTILALTKSNGPSVIQVRGQNILPEYLAEILISAICRNSEYLEAGALIVVDDIRSRIRILPI
jgi:predicted nuclease of predicted toxin-antitoxin system